MLKKYLVFLLVIFLSFSLFFYLKDLSFAQSPDPKSIKFKYFYPPISPTPTATQTPSPTPTLILPTITPTVPVFYISPTPGIYQCSTIAQKAIEISNSLSPGFWNYYNYSSLYQDIWDQDYYGLFPRPCLDDAHTTPSGCVGGRPNAFQMFWCTWTTMKAYEKAGFLMPQNLYTVLGQRQWFTSQGKYLPGNTKISSIPIGTAIFFKYKPYNNLIHVAVITDIKSDYIIIHESNFFLKNRALTLNYDGTVQDELYIGIDGFGLPPSSCVN